MNAEQDSPEADEPSSEPTSHDAGELATEDAGASTGTHGSGSDAGHDAAAPSDAGACIQAVASPGSGQHHPGQDCLSCHATLGASKRWTVAGTLYKSATGTTALSGATIEVTDADGKAMRLVSRDNGNFYTTTAVKFPLRVRASRCPSTMTMSAGATAGSCNTSGCHDSNRRMYLP